MFFAYKSIRNYFWNRVFLIRSISFKHRPANRILRQRSLVSRNYFLQNTVPSWRNIMDLASVVKAIEDIIPPHLAEQWDNTGLLIGPPTTKKISCILFTNDLTEDVLAEAINCKANFILAYHPPIFSSIKQLQSQNWKDRIIMSCIAHEIAVYSPHTACDAIEGGVNDWLLSCFDISEVSAIKKSYEPSNNVLEFFVTHTVDLSRVLENYAHKIILERPDTTINGMQYKVLVEDSITRLVCETLNKDQAIRDVNIYPCKPIFHKTNGMGRLGKLKQPVSVEECIKIVKNHANLDKIRYSLGRGAKLDSEVSSVAVCAGSGSSILKNVTADLYVTGEMSHHDLLDAIHHKRTIILCEHSNSERGYLTKLSAKLSVKLPNVKLVISSADKDPVSII